MAVTALRGLREGLPPAKLRQALRERIQELLLQHHQQQGSAPRAKATGKQARREVQRDVAALREACQAWGIRGRELWQALKGAGAQDGRGNRKAGTA